MAENSFTPIQQRLMEFIRQRFHPGYNHYNVSKLVGDASSRQYYRYVADSGNSYILAAYPEPFDPDSFTYRQIYDLLQEIEVPVPEIIEMDGNLGIVLQEDLGNESLRAALIKSRKKQKKLLLRKAIDHVVTIQEKGPGALRADYEATGLAFDEAKLNWEFGFFRKHYLGNYRSTTVEYEEEMSGEFERISAELAGSARVLCHRDFHVRNLMIKNGILYVIDFQDARWGPPSYDLASLLRDSLDLDPGTVDELVDYYLEKAKARALPNCSKELFETSSFGRQFHLMCIQRLLKALGTYGYQIIVRENFIYEQYMAGSLNRALFSLTAVPEFPATRAMVEGELAYRMNRTA
jgi:aminoglycoside/choline kinase family phosphotransferase